MQLSSPAENAIVAMEMAIKLIVDDRNKLLRENKKYKETIQKVTESETQTLEYYKKLRDDNPKLADEYLDVIRHCNGILKILGGND